MAQGEFLIEIAVKDGGMYFLSSMHSTYLKA